MHTLKEPFPKCVFLCQISAHGEAKSVDGRCVKPQRNEVLPWPVKTMPDAPGAVVSHDGGEERAVKRPCQCVAMQSIHTKTFVSQEL